NGLAPAMPPRAHHLLAGAPHTVDDIAAAAENPAVEDLILAPPEERGMAGVEAHQIEWRLRRQPVGSPASARCGARAGKRLTASGEGRIEETAARRAARLAGERVAHSPGQPLGVLQQAQLRGGIEQHIGIGTDAEPSAETLEFQCRKHAVAEIRLGHRAESDDRTGGGDPLELIRDGMSRMHEAPPLIDGRRLEQSLDGTPPTPRNALFDLARLLGDMNMNRAPAGQRYDSRQLLQCDRA